jgi:cell wall-associated NlpC family hydrolase
MRKHQGESSARTRQLTSEATGGRLKKQLLLAATVISSLMTFSAPAFAATRTSHTRAHVQTNIQANKTQAQATSTTLEAPSGSTTAPVQTDTTTAQLPPGVSYDSSVNPLAPLSAGYQAKLDAILQVSESKLGTPYVWGHSEDRGQTGFDCSNFTAYVYHHALGYRMSGSSQTQYQSVGIPVPVAQMRPGDLLVFNQGGHVGIYIGNGQMIQEGGGLKKVGYLKVSPGSYWYNHISAVKRMF